MADDGNTTVENSSITGASTGTTEGDTGDGAATTPPQPSSTEGREDGAEHAARELAKEGSAARENLSRDLELDDTQRDYWSNHAWKQDADAIATLEAWKGMQPAERARVSGRDWYQTP